ncbi:alpha-1,3-rhamnosyltransferase [Oceanisphaera litoralis]|uniref:glycosyltransferase n=1 Tax=Oceanisphaera litoralis TaxID=225144 RepID=UPI00195F0257|nr:alpha-1,3-rhamnosyltransferase [Oceanisphaera litoralis]
MKDKVFPLVSVVIPCYNHEGYVQETIKSVIEQDYENIELIIIDDGSKDNSITKIQKMVPQCEKRFARFEFRHRPNKGLCATLNEALEWCEGEYFSAIASDDILNVKKVSELMKTFSDCLDDKVVGVFGGMELIDDCGNKVGEKKQVFTHNFKSLIYHERIPFAPAALLKTKRVKEVGGYDPSIAIEDWFMWLKLTESGDLLVSKDILVVNYRVHDESMSRNVKKMHSERMKIIKRFEYSIHYEKAVRNIAFMGAKSIATKYFSDGVSVLIREKNLNAYCRLKVFAFLFFPYRFYRFIRGMV